VSSPSDLNFCENLSVLLRDIDEEIARRMERPPTPTQTAAAVAAAQPADGQTQSPMALSDDVATAAPESALTAVQSAGVDASTLPSLQSTLSTVDAALTPATAPLSTLLSSASHIHAVVTLLLAFNSVPLLAFLFDTSSVHAVYYQWFLVIVAFEYEMAEQRFAKFQQSAAAATETETAAGGASTPVAAAAADVADASIASLASASVTSGGVGIGAAASASLWRRHRSYLQSVIVKSPFPLAMTHVIDINVFNRAVQAAEENKTATDGASAAAAPSNGQSGEGTAAVAVSAADRSKSADEVPSLSQLSASPTRLCLLLLSSYVVQYVRDTLMYAPRQLDDPLLQTINTNVVFRGLNALMTQLLQDGETAAGINYNGNNGGLAAVGGVAGRRGSFAKSLNKKRTEDAAPKPKWTLHIFAQIQRAIAEFEATQSGASAPAAVSAAAATPVAAAAAAGSVALPGTYAAVAHLSDEWCPLLRLRFCESLSEYIYALYNIFALTKNANNPNGISPLQKVGTLRFASPRSAGASWLAARPLLIPCVRLAAVRFSCLHVFVSALLDSVLSEAGQRGLHRVHGVRVALLRATAAADPRGRPVVSGCGGCVCAPEQSTRRCPAVDVVPVRTDHSGVAADAVHGHAVVAALSQPWMSARAHGATVPALGGAGRSQTDQRAVRHDGTRKEQTEEADGQ